MRLLERISNFKKEVHNLDGDFVEVILYRNKVQDNLDVFIEGYLYAMDQVETMLKYYKINPEIPLK
jgi:hypothetical protein